MNWFFKSKKKLPKMLDPLARRSAFLAQVERLMVQRQYGFQSKLARQSEEYPLRTNLRRDWDPTKPF